MKEGRRKVCYPAPLTHKDAVSRNFIKFVFNLCFSLISDRSSAMNSTGNDTSSGDDKEAVGCVSSKWTKNKQSSLLAAFFIQFVKESILCKEPCLASCPDGWDEGSGRCILFSLGPRPREFICTTPICTGGMCVSVSR